MEMKKYKYTITKIVKRGIVQDTTKIKKGTLYASDEKTALQQVMYAFNCTKDQVVIEKV